MSNQNSSYLYRYKNSSNYYFRVNLIFFRKFGYHNKCGHFVGSLKTSDYQDARWLAMYIKRMIEREFYMNAQVREAYVLNTVSDEDYRSSIAEHSSLIDQITNGMALQKVLREKFQRLFRAGEQLLNVGYGSEEGDIITFSEEEKTLISNQRNNAKRLSSANDIEGKKRSDNDVSPLIPSHFDLNQILMFSQVMEKLQCLVGDYSIKQEETSTPNMTDLFDFVLALAQQKGLKDHLQDKVSKNASGDVVHFSLRYQFNKFLEQQKGSVREGTLTGYKAKFELFFDVIDEDQDCRTFNKQHMQEIKSFLINRHANATKGATAKQLSAKTINTHLSNYRTFFSYVMKHVDGVENNPFAGISVSKKGGINIKRRSLSSLEVRKQLNYQFAHKSEAKLFRNDALWYLPVSLYSGMRLNEISAITMKHIVQLQGVWCFDLVGLEVKNEPSNRIVPIAQYLLDMGLLEYIESLKKRGETLLFPEVRIGKERPGKAGWGDPISRWFSRTALKNIGVDVVEEARRGTTVCFHCNRHTMINKMVSQKCQAYIVKRIVGHSVDDDVTLGVYADISQMPLLLLKEEMDKYLTWHIEE